MQHRLIVVYFALFFLSQTSFSQETHGRTGYAITTSFAPDSSHILIGRAEQRQIWTTGFELDKMIVENKKFRLEYEGTVSPFFQERDPTIAGTISTLPDGSVYKFPSSPIRVVTVNNAPVGYFSAGSGNPIPLYPLTRSTEKSYAIAIAPLGIRVNAFNASRLEPTFSADLGLVLSSKDLPVDLSSRLNYSFSFGSGIEYLSSTRRTIRLEYLYRHISNGGAGLNNPGIDGGVFRLTVGIRR